MPVSWYFGLGYEWFFYFCFRNFPHFDRILVAWTSVRWIEMTGGSYSSELYTLKCSFFYKFIQFRFLLEPWHTVNDTKNIFAYTIRMIIMEQGKQFMIHIIGLKYKVRRMEIMHKNRFSHNKRHRQDTRNSLLFINVNDLTCRWIDTYIYLHLNTRFSFAIVDQRLLILLYMHCINLHSAAMQCNRANEATTHTTQMKLFERNAHGNFSLISQTIQSTVYRLSTFGFEWKEMWKCKRDATRTSRILSRSNIHKNWISNK